jgi:hypothetical protein
MNIQAETSQSIDRMTEILALNKTLLQLWPHGSLAVVHAHFNCMTLTYALMICNRIQEIVDEYPTLENGLTYVMLTQAGENAWAASFDIRAMDEPLWYEAEIIGEFRYSARAESPALAIARAAALVVTVYLRLAAEAREAR